MSTLLSRLFAVRSVESIVEELKTGPELKRVLGVGALTAIGLGSTIGVLVGGRLTDWKLMATLTGCLALQVAIYALMGVFVAAPWVMAPLVLIWGATVFAFGSPAQTRILVNTRDAPLLASSLIPSAFNIAIAFGAWFGGTLIDAGYSYAILPWVGVVGAVLSVGVSAVSWAAERRRTVSMGKA